MPVSPPRPKGPPLNALRAFEAAARLGGFTLAAEELGVTPGAVSQHVRTLEDWTGTPLFVRQSHGVRLTAAGRRLQPGLTRAFDALGQSVRDLRDLSPGRTLTIAALPSVAQLWLQPRLPALRAALHGVNLSVTVAESPPNPQRELFDLTLFLRHPDDVPGGQVLSRDSLLPVCAPTLARQLPHPDALTGQILLHDESWAEDWPRWAAATDTALPRPNDGPRFSLYAMAVEEAKSGAGILIGHTALVSALLLSGALVAPFEGGVTSDLALVADIAPGPYASDLRDVLATLA